MSTKKTFTKITTPVGVAIFPKLNTPDTKFNPAGQYTVRLRLSADDAQPLIDKYEAEVSKAFDEIKAELMKGDGKSKAKAKALKLAADKPYKPDYDDEGNETGDIIFNFKMPARIAREGKPDLILKPDIFDAGRPPKLLKNPPEIWGGSKLSIAAELRPFNTAIGVGVSLRLKAVQIVELVQGGGARDAGSYGFGGQEGGYSGNDEEAEDHGFGGGEEASGGSSGGTDGGDEEF